MTGQCGADGDAVFGETLRRFKQLAKAPLAKPDSDAITVPQLQRFEGR